MNPLSNRFLIFPFLIFTSLVLFSCNESDQTIQSQEQKDSSVSHESLMPGTLQLEGKLCTLWVKKEDFINLEKNKAVIFSYIIESTNYFTLYGWTYNNVRKQEFDSTPNIKLQVGNESSTKYGAGTYLSNIILHKEILKDVKDAIKSDISTKTILFVPYNKSGSKLTAYKIMLSSEKSEKTFSPQFISDTGFEVNPSPPKNFSEPD